MIHGLRSSLKQLTPSLVLKAYRRLRYGLPQDVNHPLLPQALHIAKGAYAGRRCFIVGSGPSIKEMHLAPLQNELCMVVNRGFLLASRGLTHVEFYGLSDVNASREYSHQIPTDFARHVCLFGAIPWERRDMQGKLSVFPMYSEHSRDHFMSSGFFQFDLSQPVAHSYTVVLQMLQVAVYAGFTEIYVLGIDNNFSTPNMHFYADTEQEKRNMAEWGLDPCQDNERAFAQARALLEPRGISIFNAGVGGTLQALPRVAFKELFK